MDDLIARARQFAIEAHGSNNHRRKYTHQPYQQHLKAVATLVAEVTDDPETLAAAWLHDTVEDTVVTFGDLERAFGPAVSRLVAELTDVSKPSDGNRAVRKSIDLHHSAQASPRAQTVKLGDITDNCRDICRHDPAFSRVYLAEAAALLGVLGKGDRRLYQRAQQAVAKCAQRLGLPPPPEARAAGEIPVPPPQVSLSQRRTQRLFTAAFTARDIAEPLRSFDLGYPPGAMAAILEREDLEVAGLRREGVAVGYVRTYSLKAGEAADTLLRPFAAGQVVSGDASLSEVISILSRYDFCFVTAMGDISGVIDRGDIQKPIVRMWLFGIVTLVEMDLTARIRATWPDGGWTRLISAGRLDKAQALLAERRRRGQHPELLDCMQLGDKVRILVQDEGQLAAFGFTTKGEAQRVLADLESLRNNLAHAQDIVTHDWPQIARLAHQVEDTIARAL